MSAISLFARRLALTACVASFSISFASAETPLPEAFDLRNVDGHSYIGPVRNQGALGSCYAFSALAAAESTYNRAVGLTDDKCADFSESFIVWSMDPYYDGISAGDGADCRYDELKALVDYGVCSEKDFPYTITKPSDTHMDAPRVKFASWHRLPAYDVETMKRALLAYGALDVGITATNAFAKYSEGVFTDANVAADGPVDFLVNSANHAVGLVGWDSANGTWILRNSWGTTDWGDAGYANITYYSMGVTLSGTYLVYDDWKGEDFADVINSDVTATPTDEDGTTHAYGYYRWGGTNASVTNNATVVSSVRDVSGNAFSYGIFLWGGAKASLVNDYDVSAIATVKDDSLATAYGLCLQGGSLVNSGVVQVTARGGAGRASAYGIRYFSYDDKGTVDNKGIVVAIAIGKNSYATGMEVNNAASVTNEGTIAASGATLSVGLVAAECASVTNSGSIVAVTDTGTAYGVNVIRSDFFNTSEGTIVANVSSATGASCGIYALESNVRNDGVIIGQTSHIETGTLSGGGIFEGDLETVNALVSPGAGLHSVGTLSVSGDYEATGKLAVDLDIAGTKSDVLAVGGGAKVEGDSTLNIIPNGYAAGGDYVFITSNGASGAFATVNTPALFSGTVTAGANGFTLDLIRHSYGHFSTNAAYLPMTEALDTVRPTASGAFGTALDTIDLMAEADAVKNAIKNLYPAVNANASRATLDGMRRTSDYLLRHDKDGIDKSDGRMNGAWFQVLSASARYGAEGIFSRAKNNLSGQMAGYERALGRRWTLGAAASNATQSVEGADGSADVRTRRGYLYASWDQHPEANGFYATTALGVGTSRIDTYRDIAFLGDKAAARHDGNNYSLSFGTGYDIGDAIVKVRPFANLEYDRLSEESYSERDSKGAALSFDSSDLDSLGCETGLAVSLHLNINEFAFVPECRVYHTHEFLDGGNDASAAFSQGDRFSVAGRNISGDGNTAEVSMRVIWANRVILGASCAHEETENNSHGNSVSAWVKLRL
jgi:uncharacterized protein with beta-barrel porin domain